MARRIVNEAAFQRAEEKAGPKPVVKTRGNKPSLLKRDQGEPHGWLRLQPISKVHAPVRVWARRTAAGWEGWLETVMRSDANIPTKNCMPAKWSAQIWVEVADFPSEKAG